MRRLLLIITILLTLYCDRESKEKAYLPKMEFKRTENPNYSHYFPGKSDSGNNNSQSGNVDEKSTLSYIASSSINVGR